MQATWITIALLTAEFVVRMGLIVRIVLRGGRQPSAILAWILVLIAFPLVGLVTYALVGEVRIGSRRVRRHAAMVARLRERAIGEQVESYQMAVSAGYRHAMVVAEAAGSLPARGGNRVRILGETEGFLAGVIEDIDAAREHVHLLFYIYLDDDAGRRVADALERASARGVICRVLLDSLGSSPMLRSRLATRLRDAGVGVVGALPFNLLRMPFARIDLRNHRKIVVIDGRVAWTGSQNVAEASFAPKARYAPWVDCMLRIDGPGARDLQELFLADWYLDTDEDLEELLAIDPPLHEPGVPVQVLPTGPDYNSAGFRRIVQAACHEANEEILITTPYFVPGESEVEALCTTALRGVRTILVVPKHNDSFLVAAASRGRYEELLEAGVEIHEYTKGLLHAKTLTFDRTAALIGTANFDRRSFELNYEVSVLVHDTDLASRLRFLQRSYIDDSVRVRYRDWHTQRWYRRLGRNAASVLGPLL